jgi:hypothetical protein
VSRTWNGIVYWLQRKGVFLSFVFDELVEASSCGFLCSVVYL